jgi:hypothetical protein
LLSEGFYQDLVSASTPASNILWYESLAIASAIAFGASHPSHPHRLAVFTDNLDAVQMFDSLTLSAYSPVLLFSCERLICCDIDLRVFHIPGDNNLVADALSCGLFHVASQAHLGLSIFSFQPPPLFPGCPLPSFDAGASPRILTHSPVARQLGCPGHPNGSVLNVLVPLGLPLTAPLAPFIIHTLRIIPYLL